MEKHKKEPPRCWHIEAVRSRAFLPRTIAKIIYHNHGGNARTPDKKERGESA